MHRYSTLGRIFLMAVVSILPHAGFGRDDHRYYAPHFDILDQWINFDLPGRDTVFHKRLHLLLELVSSLLSEYSNKHSHPNQYSDDILVSHILPETYIYTFLDISFRAELLRTSPTSWIFEALFPVLIVVEDVSER